MVENGSVSNELALSILLSRSIKIGSFSGCYAFMKGKKVLYVGQSKNVEKRLRCHEWRHLADDGAVVYCVPCDNRMEVERWLISTLNPKFNGVRPDSPLVKRHKAKLRKRKLKQESLNIKKNFYTHNTKKTLSCIEISARNKGIPIKVLCAMAGIGSSRWGKWVSGEALPTHSDIRKLRDILNFINKYNLLYKGKGNG